MSIWKRPIACLMCGRTDPSALASAERYALEVAGVELCFDCADRVANAFQMAHSGRWLTWRNEQVSTNGFKKAKIPSDMRLKVYERDAYRCVTCGSHIDLTLDHRIPESAGGPTSAENLQTMCRPCNSRKGART